MRIRIRNKDEEHILRLPSRLLFSRMGCALFSRMLKGASIQIPRQKRALLRRMAKQYIPSGWVLCEITSGDGETVTIEM